MATIILGGGIISLSTAFALTQSPTYNLQTTPISIIESTAEPFQSASGFAGGFLAKDWFSPDLAALGALSFELHRQLAERFDGKARWGYAASNAFSLSLDDGGGKGKGGMVRGEDWLRAGVSRSSAAAAAVGGGDLPLESGSGGGAGLPMWLAPHTASSLSPISTEGSCAQVEPLRLCVFLLQQCQGAGVEVLLSSCATQVVLDEETQRVKALQINHAGEERTLPCKDILIAAGAWTPHVFSTLFPASRVGIQISSLAGYSLVIRRQGKPDEANTRQAVFCAPGKKWKFAPELFSRSGREREEEIYVAGLNCTAVELPLPESVEERKMDVWKMRELKKAGEMLLGTSKAGVEVVREGLCFRPVTPDGAPILARVEDGRLSGGVQGVGVGVGGGEGGVFIAAGHGPWGISLSLGTGKVMAEMIRGGETSVDVSSLGIR